MPIDTKLTRIELTPFYWDVHGLGWSAGGKPIYTPGAVSRRWGLAGRFHTDAGVAGRLRMDILMLSTRSIS